MIYTVTTKQGKVITTETDRTIDECREIVRKAANPSSFAISLAKPRRYALSQKQVAWLQIVAGQLIAPAVPAASGIAFPAIRALLQKGKDSGKQAPKLRMEIDGQKIVIGMARSGKINVTSAGYGSDWFGAIQLDGSWRHGKVASDVVMGALDSLETEGVAFLNANGKATGECCYCAKELTTAPSLAAGYGPVCAKRYDLPWGK